MSHIDVVKDSDVVKRIDVGKDFDFASLENIPADQTRIFYVDVGDMTPMEAEVYIDRLKAHFKKDKNGDHANGNG